MAYEDLSRFFPGATPAYDVPGNSSGMFDWTKGIFGGAGSQGPNSLSDPGAQSLGSLSSTPSTGGLFGNSGLGMNMGTLQLGTAGLGGLFQMFQGLQANKLANKSFELAKSTANTNIANQIKSYNTTLADRGRTRAFVEGQTPEQERDYVARNSLSR